VAKKSGRPGTSCSGCRTYGRIFSAGCFVQAVRPARASEAPMRVMNSRRPFGSSKIEACSGNSRCRNSRKAGASASSSRLFQ
jgi:hypothetical protein